MKLSIIFLAAVSAQVASGFDRAYHLHPNDSQIIRTLKDDNKEQSKVYGNSVRDLQNDGDNTDEGSDQSGDEESGKNKQSMWILHGFFMAFGWGVLVPLAIGASLLRSILPFSDGTWFQIHRALNTSAMACILSGFIVALVNGDTPFTELLQEHGHVTYGFSVVVIAFVQFLSGVLRPHLHAPTPSPATAKGQVEEFQEGTIKEESDTMKPDNANATLRNATPQNEHKTIWRAVWEVQHRLMGFGLLAFAWFTVQTGLNQYEEDWEGHGLTIFFWTVASSIAFVIACFTVYAKVLRR